MKHRSIVLGLLLFAAAAIPSAGFAQAPAAPAADPVKFEHSDSLQANLARQVGTKVELILSNGQSLKGTVKHVGIHAVHLNALEGREFFDALVRLDQIQAVVIRAKKG